jgi:hypothetical protein
MVTKLTWGNTNLHLAPFVVFAIFVIFVIFVFSFCP